MTLVCARGQMRSTGIRNDEDAQMDRMHSANQTVIFAEDAPARTKPSNYPEPFFSRMSRRVKKPLGDLFGLKNFGVNLTTLLPGGESALLHSHSKQDELVYIVEGTPTLVSGHEETVLSPGMVMGFPAAGGAHQLVNRTSTNVVFLEVGDRSAGDEVTYPHDDIQAVMGADGKWRFAHKDGRPY